jgi:uncharacterized protein YkwD
MSRPTFNTSDEYQVSYLISQVVKQRCRALIGQLRRSPRITLHRPTAPDKEENDMQYRPLTLPAVVVVALGTLLAIPVAHADNGANDTVVPNNSRLNNGVVANVFTIQHQAGCMDDVKVNPQLQLAAQRHTDDVLNNRSLDGDLGSDGSTPQDRAQAAGFHGKAAETVAINPALAINNLDILDQWYYNPAYFAIMSNCANTQIGVWSENSLNRSVVVAVYGQPT